MTLQIRVRFALATRQRMTCRQIARHLDVAPAVVSRALQSLRRKGVIRQCHEPPYTHKPSSWIRWELCHLPGVD